MKNISLIKAIFICMLAGSLYSCASSNQKEVAHADSNGYGNSSSPEEIRPELFSKIPDTISGCGDYFTYDSLDEHANLMFVSNLGLAVIRINGKDVYLSNDSLATAATDTSENARSAVFSGNGYKALLRAKKIRSLDEGGIYEGILEISHGAARQVFKIHGSSGC